MIQGVEKMANGLIAVTSQEEIFPSGNVYMTERGGFWFIQQFYLPLKLECLWRTAKFL